MIEREERTFLFEKARYGKGCVLKYKRKLVEIVIFVVQTALLTCIEYFSLIVYQNKQRTERQLACDCLEAYSRQ